jgi:pSer/pThr/pTyr-binding forkhead associated (FHA) protein
MAIRLTVKMKGEAGGDKPQTVMLDDDIINLGRDQSCEVVLAQQAVSRTHARITRDGTLFFVEDLGSSFGTQLNGAKLAKSEKRLLRNGDTIAIAQFDVTFDRVADMGAGEASDSKTSFLSRKVVKDVMKGLSAGGENAYFRVMNGPREGQKIEVPDASEIVFGRDEGAADVVLNDDLVSRRHAKVRRDWSGTHVEDLGSRNGIKVAKKRTKKATLKDRDEVEIGGCRLLFIDPSEVREDPVVLPSDSTDDEEGTLANKPEPAVEPEPPPDEPPPEPAAPPESENDQGENSGEDGSDQNSSEDNSEQNEENSDEPEQDEDAGPKEKLIDFSNKNTLVVLGIVGGMMLVGIILIILVIAGA